MLSRFRFSVLLLLVSSLPSLVLAQDFSGHVVSILDGDTIDVLHNKQTQRVRLYGIDCPEKGQPYGKRAKQATSALVFAMDVTLQTHGTDRYGRLLAEVLRGDGTHVNHELVKEGWCWWYQKYAPNDTELEQLEKTAREMRIGLWVDPAPIPPWVYRKTRRGERLELSDRTPLRMDPSGQ